MKSMRMKTSHLLMPALALCLEGGSGVVLASTVATDALILIQSPARAQSAEEIGKIAQSITVRIEGATDGSGVLVKHDGNRYTILTAWHVVSSHKAGEELDIYTPDDMKHKLDEGSIRRIGEVDMAELSFTSESIYASAQLGDVKSALMGSPIYVAGFPLPTSAVPARLLRFLRGDVIANAQIYIPNGYQLLYSTPTLPGMSGGAVLDTQGRLVGIHGQAEIDTDTTEQEYIVVKTGTNQAVPIGYYYERATTPGTLSYSSGEKFSDDYIAKAYAILGENDDKRAVVRLLSLALSMHENSDAYLLRGNVLYSMGRTEESAADYNRAIALSRNYFQAYVNRGNANRKLGREAAALEDFNRALLMNPVSYEAYYNRGNLRRAMNDQRGAIEDFSRAIGVKQDFYMAYNNRGNIKLSMGDALGALDDYRMSIEIRPGFAIPHLNLGNALLSLGDKQGAMNSYNRALSIDPLSDKALSNRGGVRFVSGDVTGAIADYTKALEINSSNGSTYANRAEAEYALGNRYAACSDYRRSINLGFEVKIKDFPSSVDGAWCRGIP